jgi:tRNA-specific 2-thiouridylase
MSQEFEETVISNFVEEYAAGRTPVPCARCNQYIKFQALLERAESLGCQYLATGHYARIVRGLNGKPIELRVARDESKDQTYFLYNLTAKQMEKTLFPVGEMAKQEVRQLAAELSLPTAAKPDSNELCFVEGKDTFGAVVSRRPELALAGRVLDAETAEVLGEHPGAARFTIGQRSGLGIAGGVPKYVAAIDTRANTVMLAPKDKLYRQECRVDQVNFLVDWEVGESRNVTCRVRHRMEAQRARVLRKSEDLSEVVFEEPVFAITPGQSAVFYNKKQVLGGGVICDFEPH